MKKFLCLILTLLLILSMVACSKSEDGGHYGSSSGKPGKGDGSLSIDGVNGEADKGGLSGWIDSIFGDKAEVEDAPMEAPAVDDAVGDAGDIKVESENNQTGAGMLTAGEWKDLKNIDFWKNVLNNNQWHQLMEKRNLFARNIVHVKVLDNNSNPCFNIPVELKDDKNNVVYTSVTDINGDAFLLYDLNNSGEKTEKVRVKNIEYNVTNGGVTTIVLDVASSPKQLDLLFMIDTTGSMGDELRYLQAELRDVIRKVSQSSEELSINLSVNFYRDTGDEYVVRDFEFTSDIEQAIKDLNKQTSDGGGDYPEAVHGALENIVDQHQWRNESIKLCFMVLDAPPHSESEIQGINQAMTSDIKQMSAKGIRFIPVASSGVDTETEFLLRSWAVMTGGTYTFLTDHSGIGNSHLEPTIGEYEVEKLNDLLVRVISEYIGN